jgi:hypothetical protein
MVKCGQCRFGKKVERYIIKCKVNRPKMIKVRERFPRHYTSTNGCEFGQRRKPRIIK